MRVAVYARYSSENQSEKSIDDQVSVCRKYVEEHDLIFKEDHIYTDEAISGSIVNRPGLLALEKAMEKQRVRSALLDLKLYLNKPSAPAGCCRQNSHVWSGAECVLCLA